MKLSGKQVAASRELLGLTQAELAHESGLSLQTIFKFETGKAYPYPASIEKIRHVLESRGIEFTNGDSPPSTGNGMGIRLNFDKAAEFARRGAQARNDADH